MVKTPARITAARTELMIRRRRNDLPRRRTAAYASDRSIRGDLAVVSRGMTRFSPVVPSWLVTICRSASACDDSVTLAPGRTWRIFPPAEGDRRERGGCQAHRGVCIAHDGAVDRGGQTGP